MVEFIATGVCEITVYGTKAIALNLARARRHDSLKLMGQLEEAVWVPAKLKPIGSRIKAGGKVTAYCHGVFLLPDERTVCVIVCRSQSTAIESSISPGLKAKADSLVLAHQELVAAFESEIAQDRHENETRYADKPELPMVRNAGAIRIGEREAYGRPVLRAEALLPHLPRAAKFKTPSDWLPDKISRAAVAAIARSGLPPSRDGSYAGILFGANGRRAQGLVSWEPHTGLPSYPEVRWAVQKRLPAALRKPRSEQLGKPKVEACSLPAEDTVQVQGFDPESTDLKDALGELQLDQTDLRNRVDDVRKDVKDHGFEAIAWFQPYHIWTEETWGIYFDARKLDDLALSFLDDFKSQPVQGSHSLAALLAFGLTYAHELFHARVEAALSWQEITAFQPRHLRYKERVYQVLRETPEWLEEALANWSAWNWFKAPGIQPVVARMSSNPEGLERVVETSLDLSPQGYQEWRLGQQAGTWRTFANQLCTSNPKTAAPGILLPLESVLTGPLPHALPYDFLPADIPLRFVGPGVIADRLQSHPATFNVPPRRELERALRHFRHSLDAAGGKGGHQKWTGPDQRAFILPTRDPVSTGVFKTFLHHVGIDKATYVRQVRPNL